MVVNIVASNNNDVRPSLKGFPEMHVVIYIKIIIANNDTNNNNLLLISIKLKKDIDTDTLGVFYGEARNLYFLSKILKTDQIKSCSKLNFESETAFDYSLR